MLNFGHKSVATGIPQDSLASYIFREAKPQLRSFACECLLAGCVCSYLVFWLALVIYHTHAQSSHFTLCLVLPIQMSRYRIVWLIREHNTISTWMQCGISAWSKWVLSAYQLASFQTVKTNLENNIPTRLALKCCLNTSKSTSPCGIINFAHWANLPHWNLHKRLDHCGVI